MFCMAIPQTVPCEPPPQSPQKKLKMSYIFVKNVLYISELYYKNNVLFFLKIQSEGPGYV